MKKRYIVAGLLALSLTAVAMIGPPYDESKPPKLPLPAAYHFAATSLGSATNQYYCVEAYITMDFVDPRWSFKFCATNKLSKVLTVDFNGKVREDLGIRL